MDETAGREKKNTPQFPVNVFGWVAAGFFGMAVLSLVVPEFQYPRLQLPEWGQAKLESPVDLAGWQPEFPWVEAAMSYTSAFAGSLTPALTGETPTATPTATHTDALAEFQVGFSANPKDALVAFQEDADIASPTPFRPATYTPTPTSTPTATPTATAEPARPTAAPIPDQAETGHLTGHPQSLGLSCESRSAVDWATFFGHEIGELDFLAGLPRTDNPETGFVGHPNGPWGGVPPNSYGVHAAPVGALLRAYGLPADDQRGMSWDALRREVAEGQPVIVWVTGSGNLLTGAAREYTASDGNTVRVAPYEHTVIVTGYTPDSVSVVDNHLHYTVPLGQFLDSWGVLGNQAVVWNR